MTEFKPFGKIPRWSGSQHVVITEKIDGTNAQIVVNEDCTDLMVGSRSRWITPEQDNYGFATFVYANKDAFLTLGKGVHFGEWWGMGIQRGYGVPKSLSLFNTLRWDAPEQLERLAAVPRTNLVPVLYQGAFTDEVLNECMRDLEQNGSKAAPFMNPEGVCLYFPENRSLYKYTFGNNEPKWKQDVVAA